MKLIIQIPCLNEELTLPRTIADLPKAIPGVDVIEKLVIDDGSTDRTVQVARELGVDHIVRHTGNRGLAAAFQTGLNACLELGADVIVNTDGDNQLPGKYIPELVAPILRGEADMVVGDRQLRRRREFSWLKTMLEGLGSLVVRVVSGTRVPDAPCGFRALSRDAALRLNVLSQYTYTLETIIQAGKKNLIIAHVPIETNPKVRESRLIRNVGTYVFRSAATIMRLFVLYEPLKTFSLLSLPFVLFGLALWGRFLALIALGETARGANLQSLIVGGVSLLMAVLLWSLGLIGELLATNRRLNEEVLYYVKRAAMKKPDERTLSVEESEIVSKETDGGAGK